MFLFMDYILATEVIIVNRISQVRGVEKVNESIHTILLIVP